MGLHQPLDGCLKWIWVEPLLAPRYGKKPSSKASSYLILDRENLGCDIKVFVYAGIDVHSQCPKHDRDESVAHKQ